MNTKEKGDEFEAKSLAVIERIMQEQFGHNAQFLRTKPQAKYFSQSRQKDITFDLTVEVWPPGASRYALIYIVECKNYKKRVSVDKINSFLFDINEIGFANAKGIFISNSPLQEAAYNVADNKRLMVIEGEPANEYKIVLYKSNRDRDSLKIPFLEGTEQQELLDNGTSLLNKSLINSYWGHYNRI